MENNGSSAAGGFLWGILIGAAVGTAVGLMVAPRKGSEMRHLVKERAQDMAQGVKGKVAEARGKVEEIRSRRGEESMTV